MPAIGERPRCKCGHDRDHYMVSADPQYGLLQLLVVLMGISQRPKRIDYRCRRCDQIFDSTEDIDPHVIDDR